MGSIIPLDSTRHGLINWCCAWRCPVIACLCPGHPQLPTCELGPAKVSDLTRSRPARDEVYGRQAYRNSGLSASGWMQSKVVISAPSPSRFFLDGMAVALQQSARAAHSPSNTCINKNKQI